MGKLEDTKAVKEFCDEMENVVANHALLTLDDGEVVREGGRVYMVWRFLSLAQEDVGHGQKRDAREGITEDVCCYGYPEWVSFAEAEHPAYPGYDLLETTVRVPLAAAAAAMRS